MFTPHTEWHRGPWACCWYISRKRHLGEFRSCRLIRRTNIKGKEMTSLCQGILYGHVQHHLKIELCYVFAFLLCIMFHLMLVWNYLCVVCVSYAFWHVKLLMSTVFYVECLISNWLLVQFIQYKALVIMCFGFKLRYLWVCCCP